MVWLSKVCLFALPWLDLTNKSLNVCTIKEPNSPLWHKGHHHHHHHHHRVVPPVRISLTLSRHFSLSFIASGYIPYGYPWVLATSRSDIPDPLSPLLPIVHRFRATSCILTELLYVCSSWPSCFCLAICEGPTGVHPLWARPCFSNSVLHV